MSARTGPTTAALLAAAVGLTIGVGTPAHAATTPTISAPAAGLGYGPITITGTADPGATVTLIEAAYIFRTDMYEAPNYDTGGVVTAVANSTGHYTITRVLDSGFVFAVEAGGLRSRVIPVGLRLVPEFTVSTSGSSVSFDVNANLAQPGIPVHIQRAGTSGAWTTVHSGFTDASGTYAATLSETPGTTERFRAYLEDTPTSPTGYADPSNNLWANWTDSVSLVVGGSSQTRTAATGVPAAPAAPGDAPAPETPTTPTKPSVPAVPAPAVGSLQFTRVTFDPPGRDTGSNAHLNAELVKVTNRTKKVVDLKGWTVRDATSHIYTFPTTRVGAGNSIYVHVGKGTNGKPTSADRFWGRTGYIWNNTGDTAVLRAPSGKAIDSCRYKASSRGYTTC